MIRLILSLVIMLVLFLQPVAAEETGFGLGLILGSPTGLSWKLWMRNNKAIDGAVAWSIGEDSKLYLQSDYLWHRFDAFDVEQDKVALYYGVGGRIRFEDDINLGIRIPIGIDYIFINSPFDIFIEIAPILNLTPSTSINLNGGIGARFFFR